MESETRTDEKGSLIMEGGNQPPNYNTETSGQPAAPAAAMDVESGSPPAYDATPGDAPPSYSSIFGKLQELQQLKQNSTSNTEFMQQAVKSTKPNTCCMLIWNVFLLAMPIAMIVIGSLRLHNCTYERYIPIYLIVWGAFSVLKSIINMGQMIKNRGREMDGEGKNMPVNPLDGCINLFLLAWFIAGSYWIYHIHKTVNTTDIASPQYCDHLLYWFAFWAQTVTYIFIALIVFLCCFGCLCVCCCSCFKAAKSNN